MAAATYVVVSNATSNQLSLVGDSGSTRVDISADAGSNTANINISDLLGNVLLCSTLSDWVTDGYVTITRGGVAVTAAMLDAWEQGSDMNRDTYDSDDDGLSDAAESISDGTTSLTVAQLLASSSTTQTAVATAASPYTALATDSVILCDSTAGAIGITLPAGVIGKKFVIVDSIGNAATAAITITPDGAETIDGAATFALGIDYAAVELVSDGSDWFSKSAETVANTAGVAANVISIAAAVAGGYVTQTAVATAASPYTALAGDLVLVCDSTAGAITVNLPTAVGIAGKTYIIEDSVGNAATAAITVDGNAAETIDGALTVDVDVDYGALKVVSDGANWFSESAQVRDNSTNIATNVTNISTATAAAIQVSSETFGHADLTAGAGTETLTFAAALPATAIVLGAYLNVTEAFNNAGVTATTTCDVGLAASDEFLNAAAMGAIATVGTPIGTAPMAMHFGGVSITVKVDSDVNVDTLTTGAMSVNVLFIEAADAIV